MRGTSEDVVPLPDDSDIALAVRRIRRIVRLPKKFLDNVPKSSASLPPTITPDITPEEVEPILSCGPLAKIRKLLTSPQNIFGLFRQYFAVDFPSHDPEAELVVEDLTDIGDDAGNLPTNIPTTSGAHGPYPNGSSFALGEWYWNTGIQKSQSDFRHLVGIITDPAFQTDDIRNTRWDKIDRQLGDSSSELDWADEPDAGWTRTPVTIRVPFAYKINKRDRNRPDPVEPQDFVIEEFYH